MNRIASLRKSLSISQSALAGKINSVPSRIANFEASRRCPDIQTCWMIVNALNELGANCTLEQVFPNPNNNNEPS